MDAVKYATRTVTTKQIIVSWYDGETLKGRTFYRRNEYGKISSERKLRWLATDGYTCDIYPAQEVA